jgi:hypothetical protein
MFLLLRSRQPLGQVAVGYDLLPLTVTEMTASSFQYPFEVGDTWALGDRDLEEDKSFGIGPRKSSRAGSFLAGVLGPVDMFC